MSIITQASRKVVHENREAVNKARRVRNGARRARAAHTRLVKADKLWRKRVVEISAVVKRGDVLVGRLRFWRERWRDALVSVAQLTKSMQKRNFINRQDRLSNDFLGSIAIMMHGVVVMMSCMRQWIGWRMRVVCAALFCLDVAFTCDAANDGAWATRFVSLLICLLSSMRVWKNVLVRPKVKRLSPMCRVRCAVKIRHAGSGRRRKNSGQAVFLARCIKR